MGIKSNYEQTEFNFSSFAKLGQTQQSLPINISSIKAIPPQKIKETMANN